MIDVDQEDSIAEVQSSCEKKPNDPNKVDLKAERNFYVSPIHTKQNRATFIVQRGSPIVSPAGRKPTFNIEDDKLLIMPSMSSPDRHSKKPLADESSKFAYTDFKMAQVTKKQKWRELYGVHYDQTRTEGGVYTRDFKKRIDREGRKIGKFKDEVEFIDVKMQTAVRVSYDKTKT